MLKGGVVITTANGDKFCLPYVYVNGTWMHAIPKVYTNSAWKTAGAAGQILVNWIDANGNLMTDSNGDPILLRTLSSSNT